MRTYFFVDSDGTENVSNIKPIKNVKEGFYTYEIKLKPSNVITDKLTELPKGTLKQLFGKNITFEDEPIMIET